MYLASVAQSKLSSYEVISRKSSKIAEKEGDEGQKTIPKSGTGSLARTLFWELVVAAVSISTLLASRRHVGVFGIEKDKLKGEGAVGYIQAMEKTQDVKYNMWFLALTWVASFVLAVFVSPRVLDVQA
ncbi:hypothetical protein B7463_g4727, partial [Scytalidium lignicola]